MENTTLITDRKKQEQVNTSGCSILYTKTSFPYIQPIKEVPRF